MVKGNESVVFSSLTWSGDAPNSDEVAWVRDVETHLLEHKIGMYSDVLDPTIADYADASRLIQNSAALMAENGLWLVIATGRRRETLLHIQAGIAVARNMRVVLACHDQMIGTVPLVEQLAKDGGAVFYWEDGQDFHDAFEDVVLPMCDNISNDFNTIWTPERKTA